MAHMQHLGFIMCLTVDRELHKDKSHDKAWLCFGNTFIKMPKSSAKHLLEKGWEFLVLHLPYLYCLTAEQISAIF